LSAGNEVHVFTRFAGKRVVRLVDSEWSNAFSLLDTGSAFFQLSPGENTLRYDSAGNLDLLEVTILYKPQFLGV
jgi:hypothetical protein